MNVISLPIVVDESNQPSASGFQRVGSFCYSKAPDRWEWSDAVARMHGYEPGTVLPTTELILSHEHPDDQPAVSEIIDQVLRRGAAFSSRHRIIDTAGDEHVVVVVVEERRALIHEAIGIIRLTYGVSAERAFEVLTWRSQQTNVKLRTIAKQFVEQLVDQPLAPHVRRHIDHVLLTAHEPVRTPPIALSADGQA
jgi:hypothetical protein